MSHHVYDPAGRVERPVQGQGDTGVAGHDGLGARLVLIPLVLADAAARLEVRCGRGRRATAAAHHRTRYRFPLEQIAHVISMSLRQFGIYVILERE